MVARKVTRMSPNRLQNTLNAAMKKPMGRTGMQRTTAGWKRVEGQGTVPYHGILKHTKEYLVGGWVGLVDGCGEGEGGEPGEDHH